MTVDSSRKPRNSGKHALYAAWLLLLAALAGLAGWLVTAEEDQEPRYALTAPIARLSVPEPDTAPPAAERPTMPEDGTPPTDLPQQTDPRTTPPADHADVRSGPADAGTLPTTPQPAPQTTTVPPTGESVPPSPAPQPVPTATDQPQPPEQPTAAALPPTGTAPPTETPAPTTRTAFVQPPPARTITGPAAPLGDPDLLEASETGPLPVIASDGRKSWQVYARPFDAPDDLPRIALVISALGMSQAATRAAIQQLPGEITLAFSPYADGLEDWFRLARAGGHEIMLDLPMEPLTYPASDPGPKALLTSLGSNENLSRLQWVLSRASGYVGVTNMMGSRFTIAEEHLRPILISLRDRGLLFLDSRSAAQSRATALATEIGLPRVINDRFIDTVASRAAIDRRLGEIERIALRNKVAVGIGFPYPVTIERIAEWLTGLSERGLVLAPVSALVGRQTDR